MDPKNQNEVQGNEVAIAHNTILIIDDKDKAIRNKDAKLRNEITTFQQLDDESLYEAWERFKERVARVHEVDALTSLAAQVWNIAKQLLDEAEGLLDPRKLRLKMNLPRERKIN
ncbi:hypothetical protein EPI10_001332 [Gossypium australe]|uniref:Uncharacterized protein n=1 Tax=Gossypium australe TaxID=47621 RepID=A0A5B6VB33_9ROSI|nr:hypothetical protein EPI10_001332 [Gossypium australe]